MQPTNRQHEPGVIDRALAQPHRLQFAQLLSLLLRHLRSQGVPYERAFRDVLRFRNSLCLAFPPSEVQALEVESGSAGAASRIRVTPAFIGLLGAAGTLPLHHTERIVARKAIDGDASQHELIDLLSNRTVGLFYEAWAKYRVEHGIHTRGHDRLLPMLTSLAGVPLREGSPQGQPGSATSQRIAAYYAGLLRTRPVSAGSVERVLADYFRVPIRLESLVGCWDPIPENRRSTLGAAMPVLGRDVQLGVRMWRHDRRARLHIGPLDESTFAQFLPGGAALRALADLVALFAVPTLRYEIRLLLAPPCIKRMCLHTRSAPRRLGWDTFLTGAIGQARRPEIKTELRLSDTVEQSTAFPAWRRT